MKNEKIKLKDLSWFIQVPVFFFWIGAIWDLIVGWAYANVWMYDHLAVQTFNIIATFEIALGAVILIVGGWFAVASWMRRKK